MSVTYRELMEKQISLLGDEKVCRDITEFFCELHIVKHLYSVKCLKEDWEEIFAADMDLLILAVLDAGAYVDALDRAGKERGRDYLLLDDLLAVTDELETFYIDKMHSSKRVIIYGDDADIEQDLIKRNPHLRIDCFVVDEERNITKGKKLKKPCVFLEQLKGETDVFFILAVEVNEVDKNRFTESGFRFGRDFHFYNPRVPKHKTAWYLRKTMMDKPQYTLPCDTTTRALSVKNHGAVMACCSSCTLAFGNCKYTSVEEILKGIQAQIVKLSINNRTYSFCGEMCFMFREEKYYLHDEDEIANNPRRQRNLPMIPEFNVQLGYDRSCNLACPSCRTHRITKPEENEEIIGMIHAEVKEMCRKGPKNVRIGNGELFFSKYYRDIIFHHYKNDRIALITNGLLFNKDNWKQLKERYPSIALEVSIDAVRNETYKKLRGGNLDVLKKNMAFAGELRRGGELSRLSISFVIQAANYEEMVDFVRYGRSIHADFIHFMKLNSWGHIRKEDFIPMDVYDKRNEYHERFVEILHNPVFMDNDVHVDNIGNYVKE